jgi:hypothetical protein
VDLSSADLRDTNLSGAKLDPNRTQGVLWNHATRFDNSYLLHDQCPINLADYRLAQSTPTEIFTDDNGDYVKRWLDRNGLMHRIDGPAEIIEETNTHDKRIHYTWYRHGQCHRDNDEPADIVEKDGVVIERHWFTDDVHHREVGPAEIVEDEEGVLESWMYHGVAHRPDGGPTLINRTRAGQLLNRSYSHQGGTHRDEGPAREEWNEQGVKIKEEWWQHRQLHREDAPARTLWNDQGEIEREIWCCQGRVSRDDGPAEIHYYPNGIVKSEVWRRGGVYHRENGPAEILYTPEGNKQSERWALNGEYYAGGPNGELRRDYY